MNEMKTVSTLISPIHPGEILSEDFLEVMGISQNRLAKDIHVPEMLIKKIVRGKKPISDDIALRLGRYFGMSPEFWTGLQIHYDLAVAEDEFDQNIRPVAA